jgi:hypothetical protein
MTHRRHDDHDVVTQPLRARNAMRDPADPVAVGDRRAAEFLDDQRHARLGSEQRIDQKIRIVM